MDSKKSKKVVGKDDLRRLMKETRGSIKKEAKKIDSPLAKYPLLQLACMHKCYTVSICLSETLDSYHIS